MILGVLDIVIIEEKITSYWVGIEIKRIWIAMEIEEIRTVVKRVGNALKWRDW